MIYTVTLVVDFSFYQIYLSLEISYIAIFHSVIRHNKFLYIVQRALIEKLPPILRGKLTKRLLYVLLCDLIEKLPE